MDKESFKPFDMTVHQLSKYVEEMTSEALDTSEVIVSKIEPAIIHLDVRGIEKRVLKPNDLCCKAIRVIVEITLYEGL